MLLDKIILLHATSVVFLISKDKDDLWQSTKNRLKTLYQQASQSPDSISVNANKVT